MRTGTWFRGLAAGCLVAAASAPLARAVSPALGGLVALLDDDGGLRLGQPGLRQGAFETIAADVASFQIQDRRLAVLTLGRALLVSDDRERVTLTLALEDVCAYQLAGDLVAALDCEGTLWLLRRAAADEGVVEAPLALASGVRAFQITGERLVVLDGNGVLSARTPSIEHGAFSKVAEGVAAFKAALDGIVWRTSGGELHLSRGWPEPSSSALLARDVIDFDVQARHWSSAAEGTAVWLQVAAVTASGELLLGGAPELPAALLPSGLRRVVRARWADTRLGALASDGTLTVAEVSPQGELKRRDVLDGPVDDFQLAPGGRLLVSRQGALEGFQYAHVGTGGDSARAVVDDARASGWILRADGVLARGVAQRPGAFAASAELPDHALPLQPSAGTPAGRALTALGREEPKARPATASEPISRGVFQDVPNTYWWSGTMLVLDGQTRAIRYRRTNSEEWEPGDMRAFPPGAEDATRIASLRWPDGNAGVVKIGANNAVFFQHFRKDIMRWTWKWIHLGGIAREVTATAYANGEADIFAIGSDGQSVYRKHATDSGAGWGPWEYWGCCVTKLDATGWWAGATTGSSLFVGRGTDGQLWYRFGTNGAGWGGWTPGGIWGTDMSVAAYGDGKGDAFINVDNCNIYKRHFNGSAWEPGYTWWGSCGSELDVTGFYSSDKAVAAMRATDGTIVTRRERGEGWDGYWQVHYDGIYNKAQDFALVNVMGYQSAPEAAVNPVPPADGVIVPDQFGDVYLPVPRSSTNNKWAGVFYYSSRFDTATFIPVWHSSDRTSRPEVDWSRWCRAAPYRLECAPNGIANYDGAGKDCSDYLCIRSGRRFGYRVAEEKLQMPGKCLVVTVYRKANKEYHGDAITWGGSCQDTGGGFLSGEMLVGAMIGFALGPVLGPVLGAAGMSGFGVAVTVSAAANFITGLALGKDPFDAFVGGLIGGAATGGALILGGLLNSVWTTTGNPNSGGAINLGAQGLSYAAVAARDFCGKLGFESGLLSNWDWFNFGCWVHDIWVTSLGAPNSSPLNFLTMGPAFQWAAAQFANYHNATLGQALQACRNWGFACP